MERERDDQILDRQIESLAGRMRNEGVPPARDLWPAIDREITVREMDGFRPGGVGARREWLRPLAMAAALALLLVSGGLLVGQYGVPDGSLTEPVRLVRPDDAVLEGDGLVVIDRALEELNAALADDPENRNLAHLTLMVHKIRGNLLRRDFASRSI